MPILWPIPVHTQARDQNFNLLENSEWERSRIYENMTNRE